MRRSRMSLCAYLFGLLMLACGRADTGGVWTTRVETPNGGTGPTLVVNTPPPGERTPSPSWRFEGTFRIGGAVAQGPTSFGQITQIAVDSLGRLAVLDYGTQQLRVFGPDGSHVGTYGGKGDGPGEFKLAFGVITDGEGFFVPDGRSARISVFEAGRGFIDSYPTLPMGYGLSGWGAVVDSAGRILVLSTGMMTSLEKSPPRLVRVFDRSMNLVDTVPYRASEDISVANASSWIIRRERGMGYIGIPFAARGPEIIDRSGLMWRAAGDGSYHIARYRPGRDTVRMVEVERPRQIVPAEEVDSAMTDLRERLGNTEFGNIGNELDVSRVPKLHPAIQELYASPDGDIWVRVSLRNASPTLYDVLDSEGRYKGTASIPGRVKPNIAPAVRGDQAWAVVVGELDEESVVHGRLVPTP